MGEERGRGQSKQSGVIGYWDCKHVKEMGGACTDRNKADL